MCLSDLGRVVQYDPGAHQATVDIDGRTQQVPTIALGIDPPELAPGDWLIVHTGLAIEKLTDAEADAIRQARGERPGHDAAPTRTEDQPWN